MNTVHLVSCYDLSSDKHNCVVIYKDKKKAEEATSLYERQNPFGRYYVQEWELIE